MTAADGFPRAARVRRRADFEHVFAARWSAAANGLVMHAAQGPGDPPVARLGVSVSCRVGGAVVRNRWKLRLREAFRRVKPRLPPGDYVVVVKTRTVPAGAAGMRLVEETLETLARRITARPGFAGG